MAEEKFDKASVAYTLGVLSIVFAFTSSLTGVIVSIIGIFQSKGLKKARRLNIIGLVLSIIMFIFNLIAGFYLANSGLTTGTFPF
ncbi:MAG: hypothetical protein ABSG05_01365 [Candidatus Pacearchaeota archaeon]|jgi:steroid 5-alpha reductase family enzyme